jgi:hypothetical protein
MLASAIPLDRPGWRTVRLLRSANEDRSMATKGLAMSLLRSLLILFVFLSPALAQDGPRSAANAKEAERALQLYLDGVSKSGGRPDYTKPPASDLMHRVFDLDQLAALPAPKSGDVPWLLDWSDAANRTNKLILLFGVKPGPDLDQAAVLRNLTEYEDQYAAAMNFIVRLYAREATAMLLFWDELAPDQRTPVREAGLQQARRGAAQLITGIIVSVAQGMKLENARLMTAAMRDTRAVWAPFILPDERALIVKRLGDIPQRVNDEQVRKNLSALAEALTAVK